MSTNKERAQRALEILRNAFDEAAKDEDGYAVTQMLWDLVTALRGPDFRSSAYDTITITNEDVKYLKDATTAVIRTLIFGRSYPSVGADFAVLEDNKSMFYINNVIGTVDSYTVRLSTLKNSIRHFTSHIENAAWILKLVYEDDKEKNNGSS